MRVAATLGLAPARSPSPGSVLGRHRTRPRAASPKTPVHPSRGYEIAEDVPRSSCPRLRVRVGGRAVRLSPDGAHLVEAADDDDGPAAPPGSVQCAAFRSPGVPDHDDGVGSSSEEDVSIEAPRAASASRRRRRRSDPDGGGGGPRRRSLRLAGRASLSGALAPPLTPEAPPQAAVGGRTPPRARQRDDVVSSPSSRRRSLRVKRAPTPPDSAPRRVGRPPTHPRSRTVQVRASSPLFLEAARPVGNEWRERPPRGRGLASTTAKAVAVAEAEVASAADEAMAKGAFTTEEAVAKDTSAADEVVTEGTFTADEAVA